MRLIRTLMLSAILFTPFASFAEEPVDLGEVVVTGTRETEPLKESPVTINSVSEKTIDTVKPVHPSEVMNRVPGVWITSTGGEGHITAIRQPLTTGPVYLYLEDGVPVRSTGFFNHNAMYETNIPGAEKIEVVKGAGTALYGSDAIGGTINVITKPAPLTPEFEINTEIGEYDWYRLLLSGGNTWGNDGLRLDLNSTHSKGWRERKEYEKEGAALKWDHAFSTSTSAKTVVSYTKIDQETSGGAPLTKADYDDRPWYNYQTFDFRNVEAFRASSAMEREKGDTLVSLIPYTRYNRMELLPEWGIFSSGGSFKGYISETEFYSLGLLAKYRKDFSPLKARLIVGVDMEASPGSYNERRINVTRDSTTLKYTGFTFDTSGSNDYDFDATLYELTPYAHVEVSPMDKLRVTLGVRYDNLSYDYTNNLSTSSNRPESAYKSFEHVSPKLGATYEVTEDLSAYASYNQGFRIPSVQDLYRAGGSATTTIDLEPIKADSYDVGIRSKLGKFVTLDAALFYLVKKDDIVSLKLSTGDTQKQNAGKTEHKGVELGLGVQPVKDISMNVGYSYSKHTYADWISSTTDFSGKEIAIAPRQILNAVIDYSPAFLKGGVMEAEWVHLGSYWLDDANTEKYDGHDLINLRASYKVKPNIEVYAKALNVFDRQYAERVTKSSSGEVLYTPGNPQTFYTGLVYTWKQ